jgi:hypothetical protein
LEFDFEIAAIHGHYTNNPTESITLLQTCTSQHADDMVVVLTSVVGVELDDGILFQCEHEQRRKILSYKTKQANIYILLFFLSSVVGV